MGEDEKKRGKRGGTKIKTRRSKKKASAEVKPEEVVHQPKPKISKKSKYEGKTKKEASKETSLGYVIDTQPSADFIPLSATDRPIAFTSQKSELEAETRQYFQQIEKSLHGFQPSDTQELLLLTQNVFQEITNKEVLLSTDFETSRILEKLLKVAGKEDVKMFGERIMSKVGDLSKDSFGSHVVQTFLTVASGIVEQEFYEPEGPAETDAGEDEEESKKDETPMRKMEEIILEMADLFKSDLLEFTTHKNASFVIRTFLNILSGESLVQESKIRSKKSKQYNKNHVNNIDSTVKKNRVVPSKFQEKLVEMSDFLAKSLKTQNQISLITDPVANPVLQILLAVPSSGSNLGLVLFKDVEAANEVDTILKDRVASHLMEIIIQHSDKKEFKRIYKAYFKDNLKQLSTHFIANFVVQKLILGCQDEKVFTQIFDALIASSKEFIFGNTKRTGIVLALVQKCLDFPSLQERMFEELKVVFNLDDSNLNLIFNAIIQMNEYTATGGNLLMKPNVQGTLMLQHMFSYDQRYSQILANSLLATDLSLIRNYMEDPSGSRVIEAFIESTTVKNKSKRALIELFMGEYVTFATCKFKSHILDKFFKFSSIDIKHQIASELVKSKQKLMGDYHGKFSVRNMSLELFERRVEEWKKHFMQVKREEKGKKRKGDEIDELFDAVGSKHKK